MAAEFSNTFNIVPPLTGYQIQSKISNLRKQFRREKLQVGSSGGAPSKWWFYNIVAKIIGGEASLDNDLLSQSQNFSTQDFQDGQIATMEDGKETVSILNIEALDDTSDVQSIVTIPDEELTQSTSSCNKRRNSDDKKTLNKIAKTEPVRKNKKTNFTSEYLKIANKSLDVQIRSQELRIREVVALERICDAIENASKAQVDVSKAQVEHYKLLTKK
ncbi:uncharacterized protein LOC124808620 [Hydra vulgaris]|uniref:uncharacterized protein LOC124808620 n=1 Tax=Hydra vulgaris TaxID=6087 RepID=UPI001F5FF041|nr:uncharacterized protein LOC124808620 [Hydra vulgaris]